jgi:hypothetical protein
MKDDVLHYVIGLGGPEDWEAGRGSLYWIEAPRASGDGGYDADDAPGAAAAESHCIESHLQAN